MNSDEGLYIGIDPGASGGMVIVDPSGALVDVAAMPETEHDIAEYLREFEPRIRLAVIEHVTPMKKQGLGSTWSFGQHYGLLRGLLVGLRIPFRQVGPRAWQELMLIPRRSEKTQSQHKNVLKARAQQIWPHQKWTLKTCDAAMIAEYGRRVFHDSPVRRQTEIPGVLA